MPKSGGQSGKLGDHYEALWTIEVALDVFEGRLESITVESFGDESIGVEFHTVSNSGELQFHSVKRQKVGGDWSIYDLCAVKDKNTGRSILKDLFDKLFKWPEAKLCFVSATGANSLRELTELATKHTAAIEFAQCLSKSLRNEFEQRLVPLCDGNEESTLRLLKALQVSLRDHNGLKDSIERRINSLLYRKDGSELRAGDVRRSLAEYIVESLGRRFSTNEIRSFMLSQGLGLRDWKVDTTVLEAVAKVNSRYMSIIEKELINGAQIVRKAVTDVVDSIIENRARGALVVAPGGYGKSCLLAQCVRSFGQKDIPYLCVRMDAFDPCLTTRQLGHQLDLPESPARVLAGIADNSISVLVVDQLDAMSIVSGRNPQMWEVFEELRREVENYPNMRLLLACRDFDLHHDQRLRILGAETSGLSKHILSVLTVDDVNSAIENASLNDLKLGNSSIETLRVPFHLLLFLEGEPAKSFVTVGELFDRYWDRKQQKLRARLGRETHWNKVIDTLATKMSDRQLLFAPIASVAEWSDDAKAMASESVLVEVPEQRQYRFFHESFFDYAYARRFCETNGDLLQLLLSSEQHLFRRAQVRQILAYRRQNDFAQYLEDLATIFRTEKVRFHIKRMVASEFRRLEKPTSDEWELIKPLLLDGELSPSLSVALRDHVGWFDLLSSLGVYDQWLKSNDDRLKNAAVWYLEAHGLHESRSREIANLLTAFSDRTVDWCGPARRILAWGKALHSPEMTAIYLSMIQDGVYDDYKSAASGGDFWSQHNSADQEHPTFLIDVLAVWFDRAVEKFDDNTWNFLDRCPQNKSHSGAVMVCNASRKMPSYFVETMLHRVAAVVVETAVNESSEVLDRAWPWLSNNSDPNDINDAILLSLRRSLQYFAIHDPNKLRQYAKSLLELPHRTFAYLLLSAWTENPKEFATQCAEYLIADRRRLNIGYSSWSHDGEGTGESAISRRALKAISPHCDPELHTALEQTIIGYCDEYEKSTPRWRGVSELLRLRSLDSSRISRSTALRIEELERKFPGISDAIVPEDRQGLVKSVGSPLSPAICEKMTDAQWISAMRKYDGSTDRFLGGPVELSRVLAEFARKDRERFAKLATLMPDSIDAIYFSAILEGMCSRWMNLSNEEKALDARELATLPNETLLRVINRLHELPSRPCGSAIVSGIQAMAERLLPSYVLEIVSYYATNDKDPERDMWNGKVDGTSYYEGDPYQHGINCVRGQAARCIASLLFADEGRLSVLTPALASLAEDPVASVRTCAIQAFLPLLNFSRDFAVELFLKACNECVEICATIPFDEFVHYAASTHYIQIRDLLQFALSSEHPGAVESAARQVILAELCDVDVGEDARPIRSGSEAMRKAAAGVYKANIGHDEVGTRCAEYLRMFFNDESDDVLQEVSQAFYKLSGLKLLEYQNFISEFVESRAFESDPEGLLHALEESNVQLPQIVVRMAERVLDFVGAEGGSIASGGALVARSISALVIRQYEQTKDAGVRARCLDLIDQMERVGYYGVAEELGKLER